MYQLFSKALAVISAGLLIGAAPVWATSSDVSPVDYSRLMYFLKGDHLEAPLLLLSDSEGEFDRHLNRENLAYLNQNRELLEQIQSRLEAETLNWKLSGSSKRLLVVPERRQEYARLFEGYCRSAIGYALDRTQLANPYLQIETLDGPVALESETPGRGVTAYLVHNIADEYVEEYLFFKPEESGTKIKIKLSNRVFTGKIGSYTSRLTFGEDSQVEFIRIRTPCGRTAPRIPSMCWWPLSRRRCTSLCVRPPKQPSGASWSRSNRKIFKRWKRWSTSDGRRRGHCGRPGGPVDAGDL